MSEYLQLQRISPKDKPWDTHKETGDRLRNLFKGTICDPYAGRVNACSGYLTFERRDDLETGELKLKLRSARFCRVRLCPVCQWRRSLAWSARFHKAIPNVLKDHPKARFILLTLTVRNCPVEELRETIVHMNKAWDKLVKRKQFPALGFFKSVEVTRNNDRSSEWFGTAHPHFHCLLMVNSSYFRYGYLNQQEWSQLWRSCLRVDYDPRVDVRIIKPKKGADAASAEAIMSGIREVLKYSVKEADLVADQRWIVELAQQLHKTRAVSVGGILKDYIREDDPTEEEMLNTETEEPESQSEESWTFGWREEFSRYLKLETV